MKNRPLLGVLVTLAACTPAAPPLTPAPPSAVSSPANPSPSANPTPPVLGISETRPIADLHRRTIGFLNAGVWISNELEGGRVSDAWQEGDSLFVVHIRPENAPVNNSAWYAFKVWSRDPRTIDVRLSYEDGRHRYWPEVRRAGEPWTALDSAAVRTDTVTNQATLRLRVGPDTLWIAGQEMMTSTFFHRWTDSLAGERHITRKVVGTSGRGRPMNMVEFGNPEATRHVMVIGRQHPPEATGTVALVRFVEELAGGSPLAQEFRAHFRVHVIPLVNPDGVDLGHWRHNTGGVDLNRDWEAFNQPETRVVRDSFKEILDVPGEKLWFGVDFHSTQQDVFYTLERTLETDPPGITDRWLEFIATRLPHYEINDSPSGLGTPMSRNWFYREFGAPALIYEVGDQTNRELIREVAATAAQGTMQILLEELGRGEK
jgi:hypothetical protein